MLAWDYYIIKESKNKFKDWTQADLATLNRTQKITMLKLVKSENKNEKK